MSERNQLIDSLSTADASTPNLLSKSDLNIKMLDSGLSQITQDNLEAFKDEPRKIMGLTVKKNTSLPNILAIFITGACARIVVTFQGQTMNVLLRENMGVTTAQVADYSGTILFFSYLISVLCSPIKGIAMDLIGRRLVISGSVLLMALPFYIMLITDNIAVFCVLRMIIAIGTLAPFANPMITDYVKTESRGLAVSTLNLSRQLGNILAIYGFMTVATHVSIEWSYIIVSLAMSGCAVYLYFSISDEVEETDKSKDKKQLSIRELFGAACTEFKTNKLLALNLLSTFTIRMGALLSQTVFTLWILSFYGGEAQT